MTRIQIGLHSFSVVLKQEQPIIACQSSYKDVLVENDSGQVPWLLGFPTGKRGTTNKVSVVMSGTQMAGPTGEP